MKKLLAILFAIVLIASLTVPALAAEAPSGLTNGLTTAIDSASNRFLFARDARQETRVEGDYAAVGEDAEVSRGVGGDVFAAGINVAVTDTDELQNVVAAGANVNVRVRSARNIYASGADLDVRADEKVGGVYLAGASVTLTGHAQDAYIVAQSTNISGEIAENLVIRSDNIVFGDDTTVGGHVTVYSKKHPTLPASINPAKVTYKTSAAFGKAQSTVDSAAITAERESAFRRIMVIIGLSGTTAAIIVSLIVNALRGSFFGGKAQTLRHRFWLDSLLGLAAVIVIPVAAVALAFTVVGVPIAAVLLGTWAIALYLAPIAAGMVLGRAIMPRMNRYTSGAICVAALYALMLIPYLQIPVAIVATLYGFGALTSGIRHRHTQSAATA